MGFVVVAVPEWVPTPENVAFNMAIKKLDSVVYSVIQERRATLASDGLPTLKFQDLLTHLLLVMLNSYLSTKTKH